MASSFDLERFVEAQAQTYTRARSELAAGRKRTHWMWFIFPQIAGLGLSGTAQRYSLSGPAEAEAYLAHDVLGARLRECTGLMNAVEGRAVGKILGYPDDLKFHSSMTLFGLVEGGVFTEAMQKYFAGKRDEGTIRLLECANGRVGRYVT